MQRGFYDNEFSPTHQKLYEIKSLIQELIIWSQSTRKSLMIFPYSSVKSIPRYQASVKEIGLKNHRSNTRVGSNPTTPSPERQTWTLTSVITSDTSILCITSTPLPPARGMTLRRQFGYRTGLSSMDASWCIVERIFSTDAPASLVSFIITRSSIFTVMPSENFWSAIDFSTSRYTGACIQEDNGGEIPSLPFKSAWYGDYTFIESSIVRRPVNWDSDRNADPRIYLSKTFW